MTVKEVLIRLERHEAECGIQLKNIEEKLRSGSEKFMFQQNTIWGLYAFIFTLVVVNKFI